DCPYHEAWKPLCPDGSPAGGGMPGPTLELQAAGAGDTFASCPALTVTLPVDAAARGESIVAWYVPGARSTKPNQPHPSVTRCATRALLASNSDTVVWTIRRPALSTAVPRSCPADAWS